MYLCKIRATIQWMVKIYCLMHGYQTYPEPQARSGTPPRLDFMGPAAEVQGGSGRDLGMAAAVMSSRRRPVLIKQLWALSHNPPTPSYHHCAHLVVSSKPPVKEIPELPWAACAIALLFLTVSRFFQFCYDGCVLHPVAWENSWSSSSSWQPFKYISSSLPHPCQVSSKTGSTCWFSAQNRSMEML